MAAFPALVNAQGLAPIFDYIKQSEYEIRYQESVETFQTPNREQGLRFTFVENGFGFEPRDPLRLGSSWWAILSLAGHGRPAQLLPPLAKELLPDKAELRANGAVMDIHYINSEEGMRQTFVVKERPPGQDMLSIEIMVETRGLEMGVHESGEHVFFIESVSGEEVVRYSDLNVWDAAGNVLPSSMVGLDPNRFALVVDDSNAQYPVVVDPLSSGVGLNGTHSNSSFGFSVADGGDLKSGAHGSVIVGAPYYDGIDGQYQPIYDQGRVFVWHGASGGLGSNGTPANADWIFYLYDADDYSYFGYSIAGRARIDGDGLDDFIVGAPGYYFTYGAVCVFYGGNSPSGSAGWYALGQYGSNFGDKVAAGQSRELDNPHTPVKEDLISINGDYFADVIATAPLYDGSYTDEGIVRIWYSSSTGLGTNNRAADTQIIRNSPGARLGRSGAVGGNLNRPAIWHQNYLVWPTQINQ